MVIRHLVQHGNSKAILIDLSELDAAGLDENSLFQIIVGPHSGITIQSVKSSDLFEKSLNEVLNKHDKLFKRLAER